jgi:uncharacterized protein
MRKYILNNALISLTFFLIIMGFNELKAQKSDYPISPVPFTSVKLADKFWAPRIKKNHDVTIPYALTQSADRITNFRRAAKLETGSFATKYPFDDSDIYKIIEAACYTLYYCPDTGLQATIDSLVTIIGLAQEPDGYLYTVRTIDSLHIPNLDCYPGLHRWVNEEELSHETYNLGHLFESAVAYYQATGKTKYLDIAEKAANLLDTTFGWSPKLEKYSGHEIVEAGLVRLYRATGDERYLNLAKFFLDVRGPNGDEYNQANKKVVDQTEAVGHAVRAVYLYAGMADVGAIKNDQTYINAIDKIWEDIVQKKIYVTGGIGASGGNEGFNGDYNLPNGTAYCETCASVGNVYFNQRLFLLHGDAKYIDVLERTLYNAALSGISLSGDRFFYSNRLQSSGTTVRSTWFDCACCPPNIARLIPSVPGYIYAKTLDTIYVNLFVKDTVNIDLNGDAIEMVQETNYPWHGKIDITVNPATDKDFTIMVRIPGWARNEPISGGLYTYYEKCDSTASLTVNGENVALNVDKGYVAIKRSWQQNDLISIDLPMEPRKLIADSNVTDDLKRLAIQRGPIVFCTEGIDNNSAVLTLNYDGDMKLTTVFDSSLLEGTQVVKTHAMLTDGSEGNEVVLIPYYLWANRGGSEMQVWLSTRKQSTIPDSLILIDESAGDSATTNYVSSWENLKAIYDLYDPASSSDKGDGAFGNWISGGSTVRSWNWVQYNLHQDYPISTSQVYWWKDGAGITYPDSSYLSYYNINSGDWVKILDTIGTQTNGGIKGDQYNTVSFNPLITNKIRLNFYGNSMAQGILEWKVYKRNGVTSVNNSKNSGAPMYKVYPNPVQGIINIETDHPQVTDVNVFTIDGKVVYRNSFSTNKMIIYKSEIGSAGVYILETSNPKYKYYHKIIIQ